MTLLEQVIEAYEQDGKEVYVDDDVLYVDGEPFAVIQVADEA